MYKIKPLPSLTEEDVRRFWGYVNTLGADECWPWIGPALDSGYGQICIKNRPYRSHRIAYFLESGDDPMELNVLHSCDNPPCCNPKHLFKGTNDDNQKDKWAKGRGWVINGEQSNFAKIKMAVATEARRRFDAGDMVSVIAADLGLTVQTVGAIGRRKTWRSVPETSQRPVDPHRNSRGDKSYYRRFPERTPKGEAVVTSKLKAEQVMEIRARYSAGEPMASLAAAFEVCGQNIKHIVTRQSWKHLP